MYTKFKSGIQLRKILKNELENNSNVHNLKIKYNKT